MLKVLVTGSTGFVGKSLISYLHVHQIEVFTLDRRANNHSLLSGSFTWRQLSMLPEVDSIIHLAGMAHDVKGNSKDDEYFRINVGLTEKIMDYFANSNATTFVNMSSVKAVTDVADYPLTESQEPAPATAYGRSKLQSELVVKSALVKKFQKRFNLRPCLIYGPNCKGNLKLLYNWVKRGLPYPFGAFYNQRSYLSISNLNYVLHQICVGNLVEGTYNVADGESISTRELVSIIGLSQNREHIIWNCNRRAVKGVARISSFLQLPFNEETLLKLTGNFLVSTKKLRTSLGSDLPVESRTGLLETFKSL